MKIRSKLGKVGAGVLLASCYVLGAAAETGRLEEEPVSPVRGIRRGHDADRSRDRNHDRGPAKPGVFREIDGSENNPAVPEMNASHTPLARAFEADYADGVSSLAGATRPSARVVSNLVADQAAEIENPFGTSDFLWQWGQFLDHDIDLTDGIDPPESEPIAVPAGDPWFDPNGEGDKEIAFNRSLYEASADPADVREQTNEITGWIDASNVYGSNAVRAQALRALDGTGRLRTGPSDLLPDDDGDLANAAGASQQVLFLAGDVRANEQVGLIAMHTLFMREHNRIADEIRAREPNASGDQIYERARRQVGALMQSITFNEFLPALLGRGAVPRYAGYDPSVDARIANSFSTAAYRFGHSSLPSQLLRLDANLQPIEEGAIALRDAFFSPDRVRNEGGIEPLLRGLSQQLHQEIDHQIIDDVRNFLFGFPGAGGFDLVSLNLQRGRDHGLPSYAVARAEVGLPPVAEFSDISSNPDVQERLAEAYGSVDQIDLWIGGLAEDPAGDSQLGPLFTQLIARQFAALRDGDRFWYAWALPRQLEAEIEATRLSDVIRRNTSIGDELPDDVFRVGSSSDRPGSRGERTPRAGRRR